MILGICGKIASGKSEVLKILKKRGYYCIDADKIVHELYKSGGVGARKIAAYFGRSFLRSDGSVDREKLRDEVFKNEDERKYLENLIHPEVYAEIAGLLEKTRKLNIAIEMVYFDQDFLNDFVDKMIWVKRPREEIMRVLVEERGYSRELALTVMNLIKIPKRVDLVVSNNADLANLARLL